GFSDLTLWGQYRFFSDKKAQAELAVLLGVKAPTGVTNRVDNQGQLFDAEFQPGTGAWNGLFGLAVTKRFGSWSLDGNLLYILSSRGTQATILGAPSLKNAAPSSRPGGGTEKKTPRPHMLRGAVFAGRMYQGGPKEVGGSRLGGPATSPTPALDIV